jgi:hypothetical protein
MDPVTIMLGNPASTAVGTSGALPSRLGLVTATIRSLPGTMKFQDLSCNP